MGLFDRFINPVWHDISRLDANGQRIAAFLLTGYGSCRCQINECLVAPLARSNALSGDTRESLIDEALVGFLKSCKVPQSDHTGTIPDRILQGVAEVWGLFALADCNHRLNRSLPDTLEGSPYSEDPDEARTQVLVKWADILGITRSDFVMNANMGWFLEQWTSMTTSMIAGFLTGFGRVPVKTALKKARSEAVSLPAYQISKARYMIQTVAKASLPATLPKAPDLPGASQSTKGTEFDPVKSMSEHPFLYVPYSKVIALMQTLAPQVKELISTIVIDDFDLRRFMGVRESLSTAYLDGLRSVDSLTLAYCIVVVAIARKEPKFVHCGVWKKLSEAYRHDLIRIPLISIILIAPTLPGSEDGNSQILNVITQVQRAASIYFERSHTERAGFAPLVSGTFLLKHVMNHPTYSTILNRIISGVLEGMEPNLDEMAAGELIPWPEQQKM